jgi:hypothetical protein
MMDIMFRSTLKIFFSLLLLSPFLSATAQQDHAGIDTIFGFDPVLYNGRHYTFAPRTTSGNPFLFESGFEKGWIKVMDRTYSNLNLNYDIVSHVLLLKYVNHEGSTIILEISQSWLNAFGIGSSRFELRPVPGAQPIIYQAIGNKPVGILYYWKKELKLDNVLNTPSYIFSKPERTNTLRINGKEVPYSRNREFINAFNPSIQVKVSNYIRNNKIKVKKAPDQTMEELLNYCNTLILP